jgi:hypothetical protein
MGESELIPELKRLACLKYQNEDDVREEFVSPLLKTLGYDFERGEICRCKSLETGYYSGTKRKEHIVPDYIVYSHNYPIFVIDAKSPSEDLDYSYISQVHSYASHRSINATQFVITNALVTYVFQTNSHEFKPILTIELNELPNKFTDLTRRLGSQIMSKAVDLRNIFNQAEELLFQERSTDIASQLLEDLNKLVAHTVNNNRLSNTEIQNSEPFFIDTSVIISMRFGTPGTQQTIKTILGNAKLILPEYALGELNRTIINDAIFVHNYFVERHTLKNIEDMLGQNKVQPRKLVRILHILSSLQKFGSREEILASLKLILSSGSSQYIPHAAEIIDYLDCPLAKSVSIDNNSGYFRLHPFCSRTSARCHLPEFLKRKEKEVHRILSEAVPKLKNSQKIKGILNKTLQDPEYALGKNCIQIGDIIMALHQPSGTKFATLDRDFEPICKALEQKLVLLG